MGQSENMSNSGHEKLKILRQILAVAVFKVGSCFS